MITDAGKTHIKRYLAGQVPTLARTLVLGIGDAAVVGTDKRMSFEVARTPITLPTYDPVADKLVYKAAIPDSYIGKVYEIGIYSLSSDTLNDAPSQLLSTFEQGEGWDAGTWVSTTTRVGSDSLRLSAASAGTATASLEVSLDLSLYTPTDAVLLAYQASANAGVQIRFETDSSNYFTATSATATGYNIVAINKSSFVATGTPSWTNITKITLITSGVGGASTVDFDAISIVDQDFNNPDMVLVARQVLVTPFSKVDATVNEIEFRMNVAVT